jgi:hypothetical protein
MNQLRVLLAAAAVAVSGGAAAQVTEALVAGSAGIVGADSSTVVPLQGTVTGQPESVAFSGQARISSRLARDPDFGRPHLVVTIDLTGVSGTGTSTRAKYLVASTELVQRRVAESQKVDITFPFAKSGGAPQSAVASFLLSVDTTSGAVKSATGSIATPSLPR